MSVKPGQRTPPFPARCFTRHWHLRIERDSGSRTRIAKGDLAEVLAPVTGSDRTSGELQYRRGGGSSARLRTAMTDKQSVRRRGIKSREATERPPGNR